MGIRLQHLIPVGSLLAAFATSANAVEVLIPSYFYPGGSTSTLWPQLNTAASSVGMTAILNPASGPGAALDANYRNAVNSLRASGGRVIGYVSTSYGARPIADVKADIAKYRSLYSLDGIFLDEMTNTNDAASLAYYRDLYGYIKTLDSNYRVVGNPGTSTQPAYLASPASADTLVTFESNTGYSGSTPSGWTSAYATRRFSNLPYNVATSATMTTYVNAAATKRAGHIYVTDDGPDGNPWDRLPSYWAAELNAIRAITPTWVANGSGDWNVTAAWTTSSVPNGVGAEALLFGAISSSQTVFTNTPVTLGVLSFNNANRYVIGGAGSMTLDAGVESALIDVRRGSHKINLPLTLKDQTEVFVAEGASLDIADPLTISAGAALTKTGAGSLTITSLISNANAALAIGAGRLTLEGPSVAASLSVTEGATLELGADASLTLASGRSDTVRSLLQSGRGDGLWKGVGIIGLATTADVGVGYATRDDGELIIKTALHGDTNLDGTVAFVDLLAVAGSLGKEASAVWADGDFDYDGRVTATDLLMLEANYSSLTFDQDWQLAQSLVPEPAGTLAAGVVVAAFSRRKR